MDFREVYFAVELAKLPERGDRFGPVCVDGSHLCDDVFADTHFVVRLLSEGGTNVTRTALEELDLSRYRQKGQFVYLAAHWCGKVQLTTFRRVGNVERAWDAAFHSF